MLDFDKIIEVDQMLRSKELMVLEPSVQYITPGSTEGLSEKVASDAADWALSVTSKPGKTYILVLALGANEYYGPNRNGDGFRETELKRTYKTFETHAHVYRSHVNKDPKKSFGKVVRAFYNDRMHRVELVLEIDDAKAPDIAQKIQDHESVAVSMGCRIKFDVCSICGNKAPSRKEYCEHAKFKLNDILEDGRLVYVDNPNPVFFDISVVWRPADKTGYMLKKVAKDLQDRGESSALLAEKAAGMTVLAGLLQKAADIEKIVTGVGFGAEVPEKAEAEPGEPGLTAKWLKHVVPKILADYKPVENADLDWLSGKRFPQVLSSLSSMGIFLTTPEFLDLFFKSVTGSPAPAGAADKLISLQGSLFKFLADSPEVAYGVLSTGILGESEKPDPEVVEKMSGYYGSRSLNRDNVMSKMATSGGLMEALYYTDPRTRRRYVTHRQAVETARGNENREDSLKVLGMGGLAAALYGGLGKLGLGRATRAVPLLGALGAGTAYAMDDPQLQTHSGEKVPVHTRFIERTASWDNLSTRLVADALTRPAGHEKTAAFAPRAFPQEVRDVDRAVALVGETLYAGWS